jgi:hypothetical protein
MTARPSPSSPEKAGLRIEIEKTEKKIFQVHGWKVIVWNPNSFKNHA